MNWAWKTGVSGKKLVASRSDTTKIFPKRKKFKKKVRAYLRDGAQPVRMIAGGRQEHDTEDFAGALKIAGRWRAGDAENPTKQEGTATDKTGIPYQQMTPANKSRTGKPRRKNIYTDLLDWTYEKKLGGKKKRNEINAQIRQRDRVSRAASGACVHCAPQPPRSAFVFPKASLAPRRRHRRHHHHRTEAAAATRSAVGKKQITTNVWYLPRRRIAAAAAAGRLQLLLL